MQQEVTYILLYNNQNLQNVKQEVTYILLIYSKISESLSSPNTSLII